MISKELLSEVLGHSEVVDELGVSTVYSNMELGIRYVKNYETYTLVDCINIYELAHKCKEWLNIDIKINHYKDNDYRKGWVEVTLNYDSTSIFANKSFTADTEPEAIFRACQWIYDNSYN